MNDEVLNRRQAFDAVIEYFQAICGTNDYEGAIAMLKEQFRDKEASPAHWLHKLARGIYPANPPDTVQPEHFYEILGMIDTREKHDAIFSQLPGPEVDKFLKFLLKDFLPAVRSNAQLMAKKLPQRRNGGPKPKMPSEEKCREIFDEIEQLHRKNVKRGIAQRRLAERTGLSVRTVQRICKAQKGRLNELHSDAPDS